MIAPLSSVRFEDALHVALQTGASDVHLEPGSTPALRVDGELRFLPGPAISEDETRDLALALGGERAVDILDGGDDVSATSQHEGTPIRVHVFRAAAGISVALRLLRAAIPTLESLHMPPVVATFAQRPRGLVIFGGPTGCGKSTSLAALIDAINTTQRRRIITIEDPIEFRHTNKQSLVSQRELGSTASSFASAVHSALRADPDVIMLGEMRDAQTMRAALTASETGHLVLTTLHMGDAVQTIDRIVDAFSGGEQNQVRTQLSHVLLGVVCQRLIPRANGPGRRLAAEILIGTDAVRNVIREGRSHQLRNAMLTGRQAGMQTLEEHLSDLIARNEVDPAAAAAASVRGSEIGGHARKVSL